MLAHGANHHGGYVWPRGQRSWEGFAAHVGSAWVVDFDAEEKKLERAVVPEPDWACEPPLSPEEEEAFAAGPVSAESGLLW